MSRKCVLCGKMVSESFLERHAKSHKSNNSKIYDDVDGDVDLIGTSYEEGKLKFIILNAIENDDGFEKMFVDIRNGINWIRRKIVKFICHLLTWIPAILFCVIAIVVVC